jgi:superfamily II DNA or RNA helicase
MIEDVSAAVAKGRKVMVVSERLEHLRKMTEDLTNMLMTMDLDFAPRIDFYTGEWFTGEKDSTGKMKKKSRSEEDLKTAESANVIMATKQMVEEGLDIQALDVLVLATPMSDVEQAVGRVRRWCIREDEKCERLCPWRAGKCEQKPHPIVLDVIDEQVAQAKRKWSSRACFYREIGAI